MRGHDETVEALHQASVQAEKLGLDPPSKNDAEALEPVEPPLRAAFSMGSIPLRGSGSSSGLDSSMMR